MSNSASTSDSNDAERTLACGCMTSPGDHLETITPPGLQKRCRGCHEPTDPDDWDTILRETTVHHRTGEHTHYKTWLVGLDEYGRAIYHDERHRKILRVVPREHYAFRADRDGDEQPLRTYHPEEGYGDLLLGGPNGRDHLVIVERIDTDSGDYSKRDLVDWVQSQLADYDWDFVTERTEDRIEFYS